MYDMTAASPFSPPACGTVYGQSARRSRAGALWFEGAALRALSFGGAKVGYQTLQRESQGYDNQVCVGNRLRFLVKWRPADLDPTAWSVFQACRLVLPSRRVGNLDRNRADKTRCTEGPTALESLHFLARPDFIDVTNESWYAAATRSVQSAARSPQPFQLSPHCLLRQ